MININYDQAKKEVVLKQSDNLIPLSLDEQLNKEFEEIDKELNSGGDFLAWDTPEYFGERNQRWSELTPMAKIARRKELTQSMHQLTADELILLGNVAKTTKCAALPQVLRNLYTEYGFKTKAEQDFQDLLKKGCFISTEIDQTPVAPIIPNFLYEGNSTGIISIRGRGKTEMLANIIEGLEMGTSILGGGFKVVRPVKTLTIICEGSINDISVKRNKYGHEKGSPMIDARAYTIDQLVLLIEHYIIKEKVEVVLFDSFTYYVQLQTRESNSANEVVKILNMIFGKIHELGASAIQTLHASTKKTDGMMTPMGSATLETIQSHMFAVHPVEDETGAFRGTSIECTKFRHGEPPERVYTTLDSNGRIIQSEEIRQLASGGENTKPSKKTPEEEHADRERILTTEWHNVNAKHGKVTHDSFANQCGQDKTNFNKYIKDHLDLFEVTGGKGRGNPKVYVLKQANEEIDDSKPIIEGDYKIIEHVPE